MMKLENVSFAYQGSETENGLHGITLSIERGEMVLICGESGCGKTTLTRLINGLIPHYYEGSLEGTVTLAGRDILSQPLYETSKIVGSVFQNPRSQFYNVDTTSEMAFSCENRGLPPDEIRQRMDDTCKRFRLEHLIGRSLFELSGGEKQKIACACVDMAQAQVIVLDEPSSNLDIVSIRELANTLAIWKEQGKTIIIAEHRLYYLVPIADRILYMVHGEIRRSFTRKQFESLPSEELTRMGLRSLHPFDAPVSLHKPHHREPFVIQDFSFNYEKRGEKVLNISRLELPKNEIIGVVGNNGAGKSTFARCLCGFNKSARGTLAWKNVQLSAKKRRKLAYMVMQDTNHQLFTESVLDEILLGLDGMEPEQNESTAKGILDSLDLLDKRDLHPMSLSGGEKQRVAIGSAIASSRDILIFDEPTSGLDYRHMLEVSQNLQKLQNLGKTIFVITHDPELIYHCCTYIVHIENGEVVWSDTMSRSQRELSSFFSDSCVEGVPYIPVKFA